MEYVIRDFDPATDRVGFDRCVKQLQDYERELDSRMRTSEDLVPEYADYLLTRCRQLAGKILVASTGSEISGYVCVLARVPTEDPDDGDYEYALVSDIAVNSEYRGYGIGKALLAAAEEYARSLDAKWLRISVMARNEPAKNLYERSGFDALYVDMEKTL